MDVEDPRGRCLGVGERNLLDKDDLIVGGDLLDQGNCRFTEQLSYTNKKIKK